MVAPRIGFSTIARDSLIMEARLLKSEHGENPEYDRALVELIYWTAGGESAVAVATELGITLRQSPSEREGG